MTEGSDNGIDRLGPAMDMFLPFLSAVLQTSAEFGSMRSRESDDQAKAQAETLGQIYRLTGGGS